MSGDDDPWETVPAADDEDEPPGEDPEDTGREEVGGPGDATGSDDGADADRRVVDAEADHGETEDDATEDPGESGADAGPVTEETENSDPDPDPITEETENSDPDPVTEESGGSDADADPVTEGAGAAGGDVGRGVASETADFDDGDQVLRTENLTKRFGELVAVDGVDLSVARGEFRSVIGPNGAGKTTLFNLITGGLAPTNGTVYLDGESINGLTPHERVRRGLGRSFQITNIFGGLTVRENVRLAAQAVRRKQISPVQRLVRSKDDFPAINEVTDRVLGRIDLEGHAEDRAATLAYGDQRRLEIGLVLATDPQVVLLDEPTAGMGLDETRETMELIGDVLADRTLVLIEHDIDLVMDVSDRVTVLHRGSVLATGTPREVSDDESVQEAYLGGAGQ